MVEFVDPLVGQTISYHLDSILKTKWDSLRGGQLVKINEDRVYLVDGREGSGKSTFAFQQAKYINPNFGIDNICFKPEEFLFQIRNAPRGSVIVFDEAFRGLSSKGSRSVTNKLIVQALMESRQRSLVIFIVLPTFFLLEIYAAVFRSEALFHIYKIKGEKYTARGFKIYNHSKKKYLYLRGKSKYFSYARPKITLSKGKFLPKNLKDGSPWVPYDTFPMQEYLKKKENAFKDGLKDDDVENKWLIQRNNIVKYLYNNQIKSHRKLSAWLESAGVQLSPSMVRQILGKEGENEETISD